MIERQTILIKKCPFIKLVSLFIKIFDCNTKISGLFIKISRIAIKIFRCFGKLFGHGAIILTSGVKLFAPPTKKGRWEFKYLTPYSGTAVGWIKSPRCGKLWCGT